VFRSIVLSRPSDSAPIAAMPIVVKNLLISLLFNNESHPHTILLRTLRFICALHIQFQSQDSIQAGK
jgi:hypothetical protein